MKWTIATWTTSAFVAVIGMVTTASIGNAAIIFSNPIDGTNPSLDNPFTAGQTVDANISASGIGRGQGIIGNAGGNRYNATAWSFPGVDGTDYFTWTLTPNAGYEIDFTSFEYTGQRSGTGPTTFALRSSIDGFTADIGSPAATGAAIDLSAVAYQNLTGPIEFRLYGWGGTSDAGTFSVNDFTFNGEAIAIPEPAALALMLVGLLIGVCHRRRKT